MNRLFGFVMLCSVALLPAAAFSQERGQAGVYVGGKIGASVERFHDRSFHMAESGYAGPDETGGMIDWSWAGQSFSLGNKGDSVLSGGFLLGYDFEKRFHIPLRTEIDFTMRGKAENSRGGDWTWYITDNATGSEFSETGILTQKASVTLNTLMANAWWDIPTGTKLTPYVGGGIGVAFIKHRSVDTLEEGGVPETISASKSSSNFAWSLGAGVAYGINRNWTLDLGYRYINAGDSKVLHPDEGGGLSGKIDRIDTHDIALGIRYTF